MTTPRPGGPLLRPDAIVLLTSYVWEGSAALHALIANDVPLTDLVLQRPWWGHRSWIRSRVRYTRVGLRNRLTPGPRRYHPLERTACRHGIAVHRIDDINTAGMQWAAENVRLIVVASSRIIKPPVVARYQGKIINLHTGLLPYFRGPYSEFWAMYHQQHHRIGTSVHLIDDGIDTGPLLATRVADLPERVLTPQEAHHLNALQGTQLLAETVDGYLNGRLVPRPQPPGGATYTQPSPAEIAVVRQRLGRRIRVDFIE